MLRFDKNQALYELSGKGIEGKEKEINSIDGAFTAETKVVKTGNTFTIYSNISDNYQIKAIFFNLLALYVGLLFTPILYLFFFTPSGLKEVVGYLILLVVLSSMVPLYFLCVGFWERLSIKFHGITIVTNSGEKHHFRSVKKTGIKKLHDLIAKSVENEEPLAYNVEFTNNGVMVSDSENIAIGAYNSIN